MIEGPTGENSFRLISCDTLSYDRRRDQYVAPGLSIRDCVRTLGWSDELLHARVFIDGQYIPDAEWEMAYPKSNQSVIIRRVPGGGGQGGKDGARLGVMLALVVASIAISGGAASGLIPTLVAGSTPALVASSVLLIGGSLALNALIPPPRPALPNLAGQNSSSRNYALDGTTNRLTPYERVPRIYGRHRVYPVLAAAPFHDGPQTDRRINLLFLFGYGPLLLSNFRLGEKLLESFPKSTYDVEVRTGGPDDPQLTLITQDVNTDSFSIPLISGVFFQKTSAEKAQALSIDIEFLSGLVTFDGAGNRTNRTVEFDVQYRKVGDVTWITVGGPTGEPPKKASFTTNSPGGPNANMQWEVKTAGSAGNRYSMIYGFGPLRVIYSQDMPQWERDINGYNDYSIIIPLRLNSTTMNDIKAAVDAHPTLSQIFTLTQLGTGTGTIAGVNNIPWNYTSGGHDGFGATTITRADSSRVILSVPIPNLDGVSAYQVQVRRNTADNTSPSIVDLATWTTLRTIQKGEPIKKENMAVVALRIKATEEINGIVDEFNAIAHSILWDWDPVEQVWSEKPTANPASIYRDILTGSANSRPKDISQLDLPTIQAFHERCTAQKFEFNAVIDFQTTVKQLRQDVLATGRATFGFKDMKYSVIEDLEQATPVDILSPRTTSGFKWTRRFIELPHALRVRFVDGSPESDWKQKERIVYTSGYDEASATVFQDADAGLGVTNKDQLYTLKRRELADAALRADDYMVEIDFANLNITRGDRVQLQHDVILAGLASARVKTVTLNGSSEATDISFDEPFIMDALKSYGARYRKVGGVQIVQQVVTVAGPQVTVTFITPIPSGNVPEVGDLVVFGELGQESIDCIVKSIEPGPDFVATVTLQDYAPNVRIAEQLEVIPPYNPQISIPATVALPLVSNIRSDETLLVRAADGSLDSRIVIAVDFLAGFVLPVSRLETQFKLKDSDTDWKTIFSTVSGGSIEVPIFPVTDGLTYEIRLRSLDDRTGRNSQWTGTIVHKVIGKTSPPKDVDQVVFEVDRVRWVYTNPPRDLAGFYVRFRSGTSREWETAIPAHEQIIQTHDLRVYRQTIITTYLVKAVDVVGNVSLNAASVTINFSDELVENVLVTVDERALGWPGTKINATVSLGDLISDSSTPFWTADTDLAWPYAAGDLYWSLDSYLELTYEWSYSPPSNLLDGVLRIQSTVVGEYRLEYRTEPSNDWWNADASVLMWNANSSVLWWVQKGGYIAWPGALSSLEHQNYDFRLIANSGGTQAIVQQLKTILDVPDVEETFSDFEVAPGGSRLPIVKMYRTILVVNVTVNFDGGTAVYTRTIDKNSVLGPLIEAYDIVGVSVAGTVDVTIQGY